MKNLLLSNREKFSSFYLLIILLFALPAIGSAATFIWDGSSSSDWNTPANWTANAVPTSFDNVVIPGAVPNDPRITSSVTIASLVIIEEGKLLIHFGGTLHVDGSSGTGVSVRGELTNNGTLYIDNTGGPGMVISSTTTSPATAYLYGDTYIGSSGNIAGNGIRVTDQLIIDTDPVNLYDLTPTVTIDRVLGSGIVCEQCTALIQESGSGLSSSVTTVSIGTISYITQEGLLTNGDFSFMAGTLNIRQSGTGKNGLTNISGGQFSMGGGATLNIGTVSSQISGYGLENQAQFSSSGSININNIGLAGIYNTTDGTFTNNSEIKIGTTSSISGNGIENIGVISNNGEIRVDGTADSGIFNDSDASFTNASGGIIWVGNDSGNIGKYGIRNVGSADFHNQGGTVYVDNTINIAVYNSGFFENTSGAELNIGIQSGGIGQAGIYNGTTGATFQNSGSIQVDQATIAGIYNNQYFLNEGVGKVIIGANTGGAGNGLRNQSPSGEWENLDCAVVYLYNSLNNLGTITNEGNFHFDGDHSHYNLGTFFQNGILSYPTSNIVASIANNGIIIPRAPVELECGYTTDNVFMIGSNAFTIGTNWYNDLAQTSLAGTYDQATNTFTATNQLPGTRTLYFTASGTGCTLDLTVVVTDSAPSSNPAGQRTWTGFSSTQWDEACNWSPASVPTAADDVVIPETDNDPLILSGTIVEMKSLTIAPNGRLRNYGTMYIQGSTGDGILNQGQLYNYGELRVDGSTGAGIHNKDGADFSNEGAGSVIWLGNDGAGISSYGVQNDNLAVFNNLGGTMYIDNTGNHAVHNNNAYFVNSSSSSLNIGTQSGGIGGAGINNSSSNGNFFNNGYIQIEQSTNQGIFNGYIFRNRANGEVNISSNTGANGLVNAVAGEWYNEDCSVLSFFNDMKNLGLLENDAHIYFDDNVGYNNQGALLNNGILSNLSTTTPANTTNNGIIIPRTPIDLECGFLANNALVIGGSNSYMVLSEWFIDAALNIQAGDYDQAGNTFTALSALTGTNTLYFTASNGSCTFDLTIKTTSTTTTTQPAGQRTWTGFISTNWNEACNWSPANVPTAADDVIIPETDNDLVILNGITAEMKSLTIAVSGRLENYGSMQVQGSTGDGILNQGELSNYGELRVDGSTGAGIHNQDGATFSNDGAGSVIWLGNDGAGISSYGVQNDNLAVFNNLGGTMYIDNTLSHAIYNNNANFVNASGAYLNIGTQSGGISGVGINNSSSNGNFFNNGYIQIEQSTNQGIFNGYIFRNRGNGEVNIGVNTGANGLVNAVAGEWYNEDCSQLLFFNGMKNLGILENDAHVYFEDNVAYNNQGLLLNNGILSHLNTNTPANTTNNGIIIPKVPIELECGFLASDALVIGGSNSYLVLSEWFNDAGLNNQAGDYDQASNTFTALSALIGTNTLYFTASNGSCTFDLTIETTSTAPNTQAAGLRTWTGVISADWDQACNWSPANVPTAADEVIIADGANAPVIAAGTSAVCMGITVQADASLAIENGGSLTIDDAATGLDISGTFSNNGTIDIGQNGGSITGVGVIVNGTGNLIVELSGTLNIDNVGGDALYIDGFFTNRNITNIGQNSGVDNVGQNGVQFHGEISNSGVMNIDHTANRALWAFGNFTNSGTLNIGQYGGPGSIKWMAVRQVSGNFYNEQGGTVTIDNANRHGLELLSNFYNDQSTVNIGSNGALGSTSAHYGIKVTDGNFVNMAGGVVNVSNSVGNGILTEGSASFLNEECATIYNLATLDMLNTSTFTNNGFLSLNTSDTHSIGNLTNDGIIEDVQGTFSGGTNNEIIIAPTIASNCNSISPAFALGATVDFNILGVYFDAAASQSAGTYDLVTNTYTPGSTIMMGIQSRYVEVEDPASGCTRIVVWQIDATSVISLTCYLDNDGDGYGDAANSQVFCVTCGSGYVANDTDCDDNDDDEFPGQGWFSDFDDDGYRGFASVVACERPAGFKTAAELINTATIDCDDTDPTVYLSQVWYEDVDGDGYPSGNEAFGCHLPDGYRSADELISTTDLDCDDNDADEFPGQGWYEDVDGDGYSGGAYQVTCERPAGYVTEGELVNTTTIDCDDTDAEVYMVQTWYEDVDGDGYTTGVSYVGCNAQPGYRPESELVNTTDLDCNDSNSVVNPSPNCSSLTRTWTGHVNSDWNEPCNWSPNCVPGSLNNVVIGIASSLANSPVVDNGISITVKSITLETGTMLTIEQGGTLNVSGSTLYGVNLYSSAVLHNEGGVQIVNPSLGGILNSGAQIFNSGNISINLAEGGFGLYGLGLLGGQGLDNTGTIEIDGPFNYALLIAGSVPFGNTGMIKGGGTFELNGHALGGIFAPGNSPGTASFTGDQTFSTDNILEIEVNGTTPDTEHDLVEVEGTATISGILSVSIGYTPSVNDRIVFLTATTISGTFSAINSALPENWSLDYSVPGEVALLFSSILPVELLYFEAKKEGEEVALTWETATEINNAGFEIEHSTDESQWEMIGFVDGHGNSTEVQAYFFDHESPAPGTNYYRLRQIDFDGNYEYSNIRSVIFDPLLDEIKVFPNPASSFVKLQLPDDFEQASLQIYDSGGRLIFAGAIDRGTTIHRLDLPGFQNGMYWLKLQIDDRIITQKLQIHKG